MERHDSAKAARRHIDLALRANKLPLTVEQHLAIAHAHIELAKVEEYNRRTTLQAAADKIAKNQHLKN